MHQPEIVEVLLEKLAYGGEAMGRLPDGRAVFVPFGLPQELVRVRLTQEKHNFARGELLEVLTPAPDRIQADCRHFTQCGGCHYQHLAYKDQIQAKTEILRDQFQRIGKIPDPPIQAMQPSLNEWKYRNHLQFHVSGEGKLGFISAKGSFILAVEECLLPEADIFTFWRELQFEPGTSIERAALRCGKDHELMLVLEAETDDPPGIEIEADLSVVHFYEGHPVVLAGKEYFHVDVLGKEFRVSAGSFFQVNTEMTEKMVVHLLKKLTEGSPSITLLDVYCGAGLFSRFLAPHYGQVIGIESSSSACEDYAENLDEFDHVDLYEGEAEHILPALAGQISGDVHVIVDPPRAGLEKQVLDAILVVKPRLLAYVSCDPATLARDSARLIHGGYRLQEVVPFDLFPQTYHIESISLFVPA